MFARLRENDMLVLVFLAGFLASTTSIFIFAWRNMESSAQKTASGSPTLAREITATPGFQPNRNYEVLGFLPSWILAQDKEIRLDNLTHLVYFGIGVNSKGELIKRNESGHLTAEWRYLNSDKFKKISREAEKKGVKVSVAIKQFDNTSIDQLISNPNASQRLVAQLKQLVEEYQLSGINIDFEYYTKTDFPTARYFNRFLSLMVEELEEVNSEIVISVDINATAVLTDPAYDMVKIGELADFIVLMGYDYHQADSSFSFLFSPLPTDGNEGSIDKSLDSLPGRIPQNKVVLGIPFYGYEWQTMGEGYRSRTVANTGALATYGRVRNLLEHRDDLQVEWHKETQSPRIIYRQSGAIKQIHFENDQSLAAKLNFVKLKKLKGIAIWALGYEGGYSEPWEVIGQQLN